MEGKVQIGMIGAGGISRVHFEAIQKLSDRATCVAVADIQESAAQSKATQFGISDVYSDYRRILERKDIDAVVITLPNFLHSTVAVEAMEAGKHVLCEKPMAVNTLEAEKMLNVASRTGKYLMIGMNTRFKSSSQWLKSQVSTSLGEIYYSKVSWVRRRGVPIGTGWFCEKARSGGGPIIDIGVHVLDLAMYLMDFPKPVAVTAKTYAKFGPYGHGGWDGAKLPPGSIFDVEDLACAFIELENGSTILFETSWASHIEKEEVSIQLLGDKGGATWGPTEVSIHTDIGGAPCNIRPQLPDYNESYERVGVMESFLDVITDRRPPIVDGKQGFFVSQVIDSIYESANTGRQLLINR